MRPLAVVAMLALLAAGCSRKPAFPQPPKPVAGAAYFPLNPGETLAFRGGTGIGAGPIDDERQEWLVAASTAPDGQEGCTIDRQGRGLINAITMHVAWRPEGLVTWSGMFGVSKTEFSPPFVELPATIAPGARWTWSGTSKGVSLDAESVLEGLEKIKVPAGEFTCLRIRRRVGPSTLLHWYAEGRGLVRVDMENPGGRVHLERDK